MSSGLIPIQSITLSAPATSVTFSGIPQTYTDLVLRFSARTDNSGFNGLAPITVNSLTAGYSTTFLEGSGSTAASGRVSSAAQWLYGAGTTSGGTSTANTFSSNEAYIPNYTGSTYKPVSAFGVSESNVTNGVYIHAIAHLLSNTAAITSLTITGNGANLLTGCTFHLYGIKNT